MPLPDGARTNVDTLRRTKTLGNGQSTQEIVRTVVAEHRIVDRPRLRGGFDPEVGHEPTAERRVRRERT
jgi:hypothetical protein